MERLIAKTLAPISRRLRLLAGRAVIRLVNDGLKEQGVQIQLLDGEIGDAERYQHYGFTSHPHPGGEAIALSIGGSRGHLVVIADGDRRYRLHGLARGEVALYDDQGQYVLLKRGKEIVIGGCDIATIDAPLAVVTGDLQVAGDITDRYGTGGISMDSMRSIYDGHNHDENGSVTDAPNQSMS